MGIDVEPGGSHEHRGTHNAIVRFGLDYLELLGVYDPVETKGSGSNSRALAAFLGDREGGLVGYALATDDIAGMPKARDHRHTRRVGERRRR